MTAVVLDGSITLAWLFAEERTGAVLDVRAVVIEGGATVPCLWHLEVANALQAAVRRGRISPSHRDGSLADLGAFDVSIDQETNTHAWAATLRLAEHHDLTVYDAAYLELAQRTGLPLATLDDALKRAAQRVGVAVMGG